jgi:hypothetical protein
LDYYDEDFKLSDVQKLKIRPGLSHFFETLDPYFYFIVFTAG